MRMELLLLLRAEKATGSFVARCMYTHGIFWLYIILFRRVVNNIIIFFIIYLIIALKHTLFILFL